MLDDKDEAAIHVANFIRLKQEGYVPDRDIIIALTADEEGGPHNGVDWLLKNQRELVEAGIVINEGGGGAIKDEVYLSNAVQASEKVYQSFIIEFTNPGGHSSLPVKDNAIYHLADALGRIRDHGALGHRDGLVINRQGDGFLLSLCFHNNIQATGAAVFID